MASLASVVFLTQVIRLETCNMKVVLLSVILLLPCSCDIYYRNNCRAPPTVIADPATGNVTFQIGAENRHHGKIPSAVDLNITYYDEDSGSTVTIGNEHTVTASYNMFLVSREEIESTAAVLGRNITRDLKEMGLGKPVSNLITATFKPVSGASNYTVSLRNIDPETMYDDVCTLKLWLVSSYPTSPLQQYYISQKYVAQYFLQTSDHFTASPVVTWEVIDDDWLVMNGSVSYAFHSPHNMVDILVFAEGVFSIKRYEDVLRVKVKVVDQESEWRTWTGNFIKHSSGNEDEHFYQMMMLLLGYVCTAVVLVIILIAATSVACVRGKVCHHGNSQEREGLLLTEPGQLPL